MRDLNNAREPKENSPERIKGICYRKTVKIKVRLHKIGIGLEHSTIVIKFLVTEVERRITREIRTWTLIVTLCSSKGKVTILTRHFVAIPKVTRNERLIGLRECY